MSTLPATIPGLLRHCSPITANVAGWGKVSGVVRESDGQLWAHVSVEGGGAFLPQRLDAYPFELDLTDPTGFGHALLWLAENQGIDSRRGLVWEDDGEHSWRVRGPCMRDVGTWIRVDSTDHIEALRLAVLAVAGVQA